MRKWQGKILNLYEFDKIIILRERSENLRKSEKLEEMSSQVEQLVSLTSDVII